MNAVGRSADRRWFGFLIAGLIAIVAYFTFPSTNVRALIYPFIGISSGAAILWATRSMSDGKRAWRFFGLSQVAWGIGDLIWSCYELVGREAPYPGPADLVYLAGYPLAIAGVVSYLSRHNDGPRRWMLVDVCLMAIPAGMIAWVTVVGHYVERMGLSEGDVVGLAYPIMDLALFGAAWALFRVGRRTPAARLLTTSLTLLLVADVLYSAGSLNGTYHSGIWYEAFWLLSYVLWAAAALHPSARQQPKAVSRDGEGSQFAFILTSVLALIGAYFIQYVRGEALSWPLSIAGGGAIVILTLVRMQNLLNGAIASERRFQDLLEHASDAIFIVDGGRYDEVNDAACRLTGYSREELLAMKVGDLAPVSEQGLVADLLERLRSGETVVSERHFVRKDGILVAIESSARCLPDGRFQSIARDVTERQRSEEDRRASEELLRSAFNSNAAGMAVADLSGEFVKVNPGFATMLGYSVEEMTGMVEANISHPGDAAAMGHELAKLRRGEIDEVRAEKRFRHREGRWISTKLSLNLARDAVGDPTLLVGHVLDVSREKELEDGLRQAQKMEAIGQLAGGVAHDFNNLLSVILNYSRFAKDELDPDSPLHDDLDEVINAGNRGTSLVRQLLTMSRRDQARPEMLSINALVDDTRRMLERTMRHGIQIDEDLTARDTTVVVDRGQVEQVLLNLAVNAKDAMPNGGRLRFVTAVENIDATRALDLGLEAGSYVVLQVSDTGVGMTDEVRQKVFEPFFTTKPVGSGTGLGLATAYGIVAEAGGVITVDSELNRGTTFSLYIPAAQTINDPIVVDDASTPDADAAVTIMIVDDEEPVRKVVERILTRAGYRVINTSSPEDAFQTATTEGAVIDLVLTDVLMPQITGPELVERIRVLRPGIPVVFMSGYDDDVIASHGFDPASEPHLQKPFDSASLAGAIDRALQAPSAVLTL